MRIAPWVLASSVFAMTGCFGGDMDLVKKSVPREASQYTLDQLLSKRKNCSDTSWKSFSDERGRTIVEYMCVYGPAQSYLQAMTEEHRAADAKNTEVSKEWARSAVEERKQIVARKTEQLEKARQALADGQQGMGGAQDALASDLATAGTVRSCADLDPSRFRNAQVIATVRQEAAGCERLMAQVERACSNTSQSAPSIGIMLAGRPELCNHARGEVSTKMANMARRLSFEIQNYQRIQRADAPGRVEEMKRSIRLIEEDIPGNVAEAQKRESELSTRLQELDDKFQKNEAYRKRRLAAFKRVTELSQWTVVEGEPRHVGSRVTVEYGATSAGSDVPKDFVFRNALDDTEDASSSYQLILRSLFAKFENSGS